MSRKYSGTDGVRGRVGEHPLTADLTSGRDVPPASCGRQRKAGVVIGKETRRSGYMFESASEAGLAAAGANVLLLGPMPTPAVADDLHLYACAGILSRRRQQIRRQLHQVFFRNGGEKLADEVELVIEEEIDKPFVTADSVHMERPNGSTTRLAVTSNSEGYDAVSQSFEWMKTALDCAHGATYKVAPAVLRELGAKVSDDRNRPDGININDHCGSTEPEAMQKHVVDTGSRCRHRAGWRW